MEASEFYARQSACKKCVRERARQWRLANLDRYKAGKKAKYNADKTPWQERHRKTYSPAKGRELTLARHGVSEEDYWALLSAQGGACACCGSFDPGTGRQVFCFDHDHACCPTGFSCEKCRRGLLCSNCNTAEGLVGGLEGALALVAYLEGRL